MELRGKIKKAAGAMELCATTTVKRDGIDRQLRRCIVDPNAEEDELKSVTTRFDIEWFVFLANCERTCPALKPDWFIETAHDIRVLPIFEDFDEVMADILQGDDWRAGMSPEGIEKSMAYQMEVEGMQARSNEKADKEWKRLTSRGKVKEETLINVMKRFSEKAVEDLYGRREQEGEKEKASEEEGKMKGKEEEMQKKSKEKSLVGEREKAKKARGKARKEKRMNEEEEWMKKQIQ